MRHDYLYLANTLASRFARWIPHPAGHADYLAASICVTCDNCYADCDGNQVGCPEN